jgi:pimeloyl-ACP methyl ester carboxylesterase
VKITLDQFVSQNPIFGYWKFFTSADCPLLLRRRLPIFWNAVIRTGDECVVPMAEIEDRLRAEVPPVEWQQRPVLWDQGTYDTYLTAYWRGGWEAPMNWYKAFLENFEDELQFVGTKLESPFLIVLGEKDPAASLQATEGTDKFLANYQIILLPCGHWIPQESGSAVARTVIKWLEALQIKY